MKKNNDHLTVKKGLVIFAVLFVLLYIIIYIVPRVFDIFTSTYLAEYGTLEVKQEAECLIVRNEKVYKAPSSGSVERLEKDGQLLRAGSPVVSVGGGEEESDMRGVVSYRSDGFESRFTPENMADLTADSLASYRDSESRVTEAAGDTAEAGDVIFKIIDNSQWYMVCWMSEEEASIFSEGSSVSVRPDGENEVEMTVYSLTAQDEERRVILSCNRFYEGFDKYRVVECEIIASAYSGIILETDSIVEEDGVRGVYVVDKFGENNFTPVNILSSQGGKTVVQRNFFYDAEGNSVATVSTYDEVLRHAKNDETEG